MSDSNLRPGTTYYWSVQAIDSAFAGGTFAAEHTFVLAAPAAPQLLSVERTTNGFRIAAAGSAGWGYGLASTTNLIAPAWARLGVGIADNSGKIVFTDTNAELPQRFYRGMYP